MNNLSFLLVVIAVILLFGLFFSIFDHVVSKKEKFNWRVGGICLAVAFACLGLKYYIVDNYAEINDDKYRVVYNNVTAQKNADLSSFVQNTALDGKITRNEYSSIKSFAKSNNLTFDSPVEKLDLGGYEVTPIKLEKLAPSVIYLTEGFGAQIVYMSLIISLIFFGAAGFLLITRKKNSEENPSEENPSEENQENSRKPLRLSMALTMGTLTLGAFIIGTYNKSVLGNEYKQEVQQFFEANKGNQFIDELRVEMNESKNISSTIMLKILTSPKKIEKYVIIETLKKINTM